MKTLTAGRYDYVASRIATGAAPTSIGEIEHVAAAGFTHVIDCRAERDSALAFRQLASHIAYLWNPTHDDGSAKPGVWFDRTVDFARRALADPDARVLVYCAAGINRGPSAAYAILRTVLGMSAAEATEAIRTARPAAGIAYAADYEHALLEHDSGEAFTVTLDGRTFTLPARLTSFVPAALDRARRGDLAALAGVTDALFGTRAADARAAGLTVEDLEDIVAAYPERPCDLCDAAVVTDRHAENEICWAADCATCGTPMVVWRHHGTEPSDAEHVAMLAMLDDVAAARYSGQRWLIDQHRRTIPGHWHAHARPRPAINGEHWAELRPRLRRLAALGRPDPWHGWRAWALNEHGILVSKERRAAWPERRQRAQCTAARPCPTPATPECLCGLAFFGALDDTGTCYGPDADVGDVVWGAITTEGRVLRDHALLGGTWRCEEAELVALVVGNALGARAEELEDRYGVRVLVAPGGTVEAVAATARAAGLPAVDRPPPSTVAPVLPTIDEILDADPAQIGGGAWTTHGVGRHLISVVPDPQASTGREVLNRGDAHATARFTWYRPGEHRLAFSPEECDAILAAVEATAPGPYGRRPCGIIGQDGPGRWVWERAQQALVVANATWWRLSINQLRNVTVNSYGPADGLPWHTDATPLDDTFRVSLVAMLSDPADYDGGRLEFHHDDEPTWAPQDRGTVIVFPAWLLHRVTPVTSGERKVLVAFAHNAGEGSPGANW